MFTRFAVPLIDSCAFGLKAKGLGLILLSILGFSPRVEGIILNRSHGQNLQKRVFTNARLHTPTVRARFETQPIPYGQEDTDDAVIWLNSTEPEKSLILGTSKYKGPPEESAGLGVYQLTGEELAFLYGDRLNNIDIPSLPVLPEARTSVPPAKNRAIASNRSISGLTIFEVSLDKVEKIRDIPLTDSRGQKFPVYGLCTARIQNGSKIHSLIDLILIPTKNGSIYIFKIENLDGPPSLISATIYDHMDLSLFLKPEDDLFIQQVVTKSAKAEGDDEAIEEKLAERFALEGCTYDRARSRWLVGMENYGVWAVPDHHLGLVRQPFPLFKIGGSWADMDQWGPSATPFPITDDIEGLDIFQSEANEYLLFSTQGISTVGVFNLSLNQMTGVFNVKFEDHDPVTATDGLAVNSGYLGPLFPQGALVLHDDTNESPSGDILNANYKILDLKDLKSVLKIP